MTLQQGSIVRALIPDAQGRNPKNRRTVLVTSTEEIASASLVVVAAITGTFDRPLSEKQIELPWTNLGHPVTGLTKPSVVVCDWLVKVPICDVRATGHRCPKSILEQILNQIPRPKVD